MLRQSSEAVTVDFFRASLLSWQQSNRSIMHTKDSAVVKVVKALALLAFVVSSCAARCPTRSEVQSFELNQIVGDWYMVAATPTSGNSVSKCAHFNITSSSPESFHIEFTAVSRRSHRPVTFVAAVRTDEDNNGIWQLRGSKRLLGPFKHRVIAVESGSYLVMVVCGANNPALPLHEFSVILSHEKTLPPVTMTLLKKKLGLYFRKDKIIDVDQDVCIY